MSAAPEGPCPAGSYHVTVAGHLDDHWVDWLGGHALRRNDDASTTIIVAAVDQARLHGVLIRIRDIGVRLLAVQLVDDRSATEPGIPPSSAAMLGRRLRTERLTLRPATEDDVEATWAYRRLDAVNEWLTGVPVTLEDYRSMFVEPARLAATVIVELAGDSSVVGDFMLPVEDAWSQ